MNEVIELLMNHRSIRKFTADPIADSVVEKIVRAAQMASTSSNVQAYSVITIKDKALREKIMHLSGKQEYITECPVFLVWCADLYRLGKASEKHAEQDGSGALSETYADSTENLLVAAIDAALAAQNAAVAAESLGYGICYIGAVRNHIAELSALLQLPELVVPLFGMCIGVPAQNPLTRPRLPVEGVLHTDRYQTERVESWIDRYDEIYVRYMSERSGGKITTPWSAQMRKRLTEPIRLHMKQFLQDKGFMKR
jgi:FMN reductase (NADPH)